MRFLLLFLLTTTASIAAAPEGVTVKVTKYETPVNEGQGVTTEGDVFETANHAKPVRSKVVITMSGKLIGSGNTDVKGHFKITGPVPNVAPGNNPKFTKTDLVYHATSEKVEGRWSQNAGDSGPVSVRNTNLSAN